MFILYVFRSEAAKSDRYLVELTSKFHFALPMQPRDKPMDIDSSFHGTLQGEYAVRYLEKIGVAPTAENIRLVHQVWHCTRWLWVGDDTMH